MSDKNIYRVVSIPNTYSIVINAGYTSNVSIGDFFEIYGKSEEIFDPITKESLGALDFVKARVEVVTCYEKMCICESTERTVSGLMVSLAMIAAPWSSERKSLNVDENEVGMHNDEYGTPIKIGDSARYIKRPIQIDKNEMGLSIEENPISTESTINTIEYL